ncbi:MAG: tRNA uridine-5-carboxymethylaminomethyl(34) synthesis GTPase MnmE [Bacteriovoracaceae bacterium]
MYSPGLIIAKSSGEGSAAIALLRLSGFDSFELFDPFFSRKISQIRSNHSKFVRLEFDGELLDECVVTPFSSPNSYTGENILELSVHGNPLQVSRIIDFFCQTLPNCRLAQPGEFTYRALKNKKIDLTQVESLDLLLTAKTIQGVKLGLRGLSGEIHDYFLKLRDEYLRLKVFLELLIDFSEDIGEKEAIDGFNKSFLNFRKSVQNLSARVVQTSSSILSPSIVLFGTPNAGKSTIFNFLLQTSRSIVSNIPGTTRDYITESISIGGNQFSLIDTAGVRSSSDVIEVEGVARSFNVFKHAFFKIGVLNPFYFLEENILLFKEYAIDVLIVSHSDKFCELSNDQKNVLSTFVTNLQSDILFFAGPIEPVKSGGPMGPGFYSGPIEPLFTNGPIGPSSEFGSIEPLFNLINRKYLELLKNDPILIPRQRELIVALSKCVEQFDRSEIENDILVASHKLQSIGDVVDQLLGIVTPDDVLSNLFSNFCIGK